MVVITARECGLRDGKFVGESVGKKLGIAVEGTAEVGRGLETVNKCVVRLVMGDD